MCKETHNWLIQKLYSCSDPALVRPRSQVNHLPAQEEKEKLVRQHICQDDAPHHHHDDYAQKAHPKPAVKIEQLHREHNHSHEDHDHEHHDDIVSLSHRHHDHQHPIHLMKGVAGIRQHSCHAGDGHDHGSSHQASGGVAPLLPQISFGGGRHHEEGEHEHCPHCDEHLINEKCPKCGYKHQD